jgi:hypothetical protein
MAIYHYSQKPVSRRSGRSAPAAAAYRAGAKLDGPDGVAHDYRRRSGVLASSLVVPEGSSWARDRQQLWSAAEAAEARKDARTAREHEIALPSELGEAEAVALAQSFARELRDTYGCAVDVSVHRGHTDQRNIHAHLLATTREATAEGLGEKVAPELSDKKRAGMGLTKSKHELEQWRGRWSQLANEHMAAAGVDQKIDHRSLEAQGADRSPQPKIGGAAHAMERRGTTTERGTAALEVEQANQDPDHRFEVALQRQREHVDALEERAARAPKGVNAKELKREVIREIAPEFRAHESAYNNAAREHRQARDAADRAEKRASHYGGFAGALRAIRHPIDAHRAGKELDAAEEKEQAAKGRFDGEKEARKEWKQWADEPRNKQRIHSRASEIRDGLEARQQLPAARQELKQLERKHEPQQRHKHERQHERERDGPQLGM